MTRAYVDMVADTIDAGHVEFLRQARGLGDELVVGVHADDDCEWLHRRPALTLDQRTRLVAECQHVDRVVAGAPVFTTQAWLRAQGIDRVVHSGELSERALRYWYRVPIELGILRGVHCRLNISDTDLHGHLRIRETQAQAPASLGARARRRLRRWLPRVDGALRRRAFVSGLQHLADALRGTPIERRYWVVGGLLLGWAREGRPLASDLQDADFSYLDEDHDRFLASVPALANAGFKPLHRFSSAEGRYVEHRFRRDDVDFEFFRMTPVGNRWRYSLFVLGEEPIELVAEVPAQQHVTFRFLGREWHRVVDHDLALRSIYGDWRTNRPTWTYTSDCAIVDHIPIALFPIDWAWPDAISHGPGERPPANRM